jgi:hypothetical protein
MGLTDKKKINKNCLQFFQAGIRSEFVERLNATETSSSQKYEDFSWLASPKLGIYTIERNDKMIDRYGLLVARGIVEITTSDTNNL